MKRTACFIAYFWLLLGPAAACAHAAPTAYDPSPGAVLTTPPSRISLEFSEELEPTVSAVQIRGPSGTVVGSGTVAEGPAKTVSAVVQSSESGPYTVSWRSVSADDGDIAQGSYGFSVRSPYAGDIRSRVNHGVDVPEALTVWLELAGQSMLVGAAMLWMLIGGPMRLRLARRLSFVAVLGCALSAAGALAWVGMMAAGLASWNGTPASNGIFDALHTTAGQFAVLRAVVAAAAACVWVTACRRMSVSRAGWLLFAMIGLHALLRARVSHAAASPLLPEFSVAVNAVHLLGKELWIGGLLAFCAAVLPALRTEGAAVFARVLCMLSRICAAALAVGGLTGCYMVWLHLKSWDNLLTTHWGLGLVTLLLFTFLLVSLRLFHQFRLDPAAARAATGPVDEADAETLGLACYSLWTETLVGLAVLFVSAGMINTMPPLDAEPRHFDGFAAACVFAAACIFVLSGVLRTMAVAVAGRIRENGRPCPPFESQVLWFVFIVDIVLLALLGYHGAMHTSGGFAERCVLKGGTWEESAPQRDGDILAPQPKLGCTFGSGAALTHVTDAREYLRLTASGGTMK